MKEKEKKSYERPSVRVVKLQPAQMLAQSMNSGNKMGFPSSYDIYSGDVLN